MISIWKIEVIPLNHIRLVIKIRYIIYISFKNKGLNNIINK